MSVTPPPHNTPCIFQRTGSWWRSEHIVQFVPQMSQRIHRSPQCERDLRPFNMRLRITSMPPRVLSLLIQPWVLLRLMFFGWYSVPLVWVRTCWYCPGGCWNTLQPSACEAGSLDIGGLVVLETNQLLKDLRWKHSNHLNSLERTNYIFTNKLLLSKIFLT